MPARFICDRCDAPAVGSTSSADALVPNLMVCADHAAKLLEAWIAQPPTHEAPFYLDPVSRLQVRVVH